jgi:hypothetical protein
MSRDIFLPLTGEEEVRDIQALVLPTERVLLGVFQGVS